MACRLVGTKPLYEPKWNIVNLNLRNKILWNLSQNSYIFIPENTFEYVCEMSAILSWPQCVEWQQNDMQIDITSSLTWHYNKNVEIQIYGTMLIFFIWIKTLKKLLININIETTSYTFSVLTTGFWKNLTRSYDFILSTKSLGWCHMGIHASHFIGH